MASCKLKSAGNGTVKHCVKQKKPVLEQVRVASPNKSVVESYDVHSLKCVYILWVTLYNSIIKGRALLHEHSGLR